MNGEPEFRTHRWRSRDGLLLYSRVYEAAGPAAPAVLCLPGLMRNSRDFEDLAPHLSVHYQVICPDLRGRGLSDRDPVWQNYQPETYLGDLVELVGGLGVRRMAVIGTSMSGLLAIMLPGLMPAAITGLVLNDIGPEIDPAGVARIQGYAGKMPPVHTWEDAVAQLRTLYSGVWPGLSDAMWVRLAQRTYREDGSGTPVVDCDPRVGDALRAVAPAGDLWGAWAQLGALPVLAIRAAMSDLLSVATFARMQHEKPDLVQLTVATRGHVPLLDEPECLAAIDAFLAGVAG